MHLVDTYDQLNFGALASMELVVRRLLSIIENVICGNDSGDWSASRFLVTRRGPGDAMSRALHRQAADEARTDNEVQDTRRKAAAAVVDAAAAGAVCRVCLRMMMEPERGEAKVEEITTVAEAAAAGASETIPTIDSGGGSWPLPLAHSDGNFSAAAIGDELRRGR